MKALFTLLSLAAVVVSGYAQTPRPNLPMPTAGGTNIPFPTVRFPTVSNPGPAPEARVPDFKQLVATGDSYFNQKRYSEAIDSYTKALNLQQDSYTKDQLMRAQALQAHEKKEVEAIRAEEEQKKQDSVRLRHEETLRVEEERKKQDSIHLAHEENIRIEEALRTEEIRKTEEERKVEAARILREEFITRTLTDNSWKNAALVCDVTGSMYLYTDQVFTWLKDRIAANDSSIQRVVLFNDNGKHDLNIPRGLYSFKPTTYENTVKRVRTAEKEGSGGDEYENNIQALLKAQKDCPTCEQLIMINDNNKPWDFALASQVTKPVHVFVCGPQAALEPAFLNLARMTKGSVHFYGKSYTGLDAYAEGATLNVEDWMFVVRDGNFVRVN